RVLFAHPVPVVSAARARPGPGESTVARRVKGDVRMSDVIDKAVRDRQRPLGADLVVPFRPGFSRRSVAESARIVKSVTRRLRRHNAGRRHVESELFAALTASWRA